MMYLAAILVLLACGVHGDLQIPGACNFTDLNAQPFSPLSLTGKWYQVERTPNAQELGQCSTTTFSYTNGTLNAGVSNREVHEATARYRNGTFSLLTNTSSVVINFTGSQYEYALLKSDYQNYALLYSCRGLANNTKIITAWKLAKAANLHTDYKNIIDTAVKTSADLQNATWISVSHDTASCRVNSANQFHTLHISVIVFFSAIFVLQKV